MFRNLDLPQESHWNKLDYSWDGERDSLHRKMHSACYTLWMEASWMMMMMKLVFLMRKRCISLATVTVHCPSSWFSSDPHREIESERASESPLSAREKPIKLLHYIPISPQTWSLSERLTLAHNQSSDERKTFSHTCLIYCFFFFFSHGPVPASRLNIKGKLIWRCAATSFMLPPFLGRCVGTTCWCVVFKLWVCQCLDKAAHCLLASIGSINY